MPLKSSKIFKMNYFASFHRRSLMRVNKAWSRSQWARQARLDLPCPWRFVKRLSQPTMILQLSSSRSETLFHSVQTTNLRSVASDYPDQWALPDCHSLLRTPMIRLSSRKGCLSANQGQGASPFLNLVPTRPNNRAAIPQDLALGA